jgi:hypothetical protein
LLETESNKKLIIGIFALLAILLLGYNGYKFMSLYGVPLVGESSESRLAMGKWMRLEDFVLNKNNKTWNDNIENLIKETPLPEANVEDVHEDVVPIVNTIQEQDYKRDVLPDLAGIIKTLNPDGKSVFAVIVNNKLYYKNETVAGFAIKEITEKGIYLTKGKRSWFIESPKVSYSVDRGN